MIGIIIGLDKESRELLRSHLDYNKWEESGLLWHKSNAAHYQVCGSRSLGKSSWGRILGGSASVEKAHAEQCA